MLSRMGTHLPFEIRPMVVSEVTVAAQLYAEACTNEEIHKKFFRSGTAASTFYAGAYQARMLCHMWHPFVVVHKQTGKILGVASYYTPTMEYILDRDERFRKQMDEENKLYSRTAEEALDPPTEKPLNNVQFGLRDYIDTDYVRWIKRTTVGIQFMMLSDMYIDGAWASLGIEREIIRHVCAKADASSLRLLTRGWADYHTLESFGFNTKKTLVIDTSEWVNMGEPLNVAFFPYTIRYMIREPQAGS